MTREQILEILENYKLRIPPTVYYDLLADVQEVEEEQEPTTKNDSPKYCDRNICLKNEYNNVGCEDCEVTKSQEPTTKNDLGVDCISRESVLKLIYDYKENHSNDREHYPINYGTLLDMIRWVRNLPSVTPQPRKGHWIKGYTYPDGEYWKCDKCNELIKVKYPMDYCNNCGSDNSREIEE